MVDEELESPAGLPVQVPHESEEPIRLFGVQREGLGHGRIGTPPRGYEGAVP